MISVIIPAHNESNVINRTLAQLVNGTGSDQLSIVVVCNGCVDDTASIAREFGSAVRVIETEVASKTNALNLGDQVSSGFPRIYVDADIIITIEAIRALADRLEKGDVLAVAPTPDIQLSDCSWPVRLYYSIRQRLPSARQGIGGSGVYGLSEAGRARFAQFPEIIADDTYVRLQFTPKERETLDSVKSKVFPPRTIRQLIRVRIRAYAGTFELLRLFPDARANRDETNGGSLIGLFTEPRLWPGLVTYCYVNLVARFRAKVRLRTKGFKWHRDDTSRPPLSASSA